MTRKLTLALASLLFAAVAFAHGGHKHVTGTVASLSTTAIEVKTANATVAVPLSPATRYYHGSGIEHPATAAEVQKGARVVVHPGADGTAVEVHIP